jgi:phage tail-like protein
VNSNGWHPGWLADQLPRPLAEDHFTRQFVGIFEEIAGGVRERVVGFHHDLDVGVAPAEFVRWMGGWLGLLLDPSLPEAHQRSLVRAAGALLPLRGTKRGLKGLLEAFTRGQVEVEDGGGVFREGQAPVTTNRVVVRLTSAGGLNEQHLLDLVKHEVPASAIFELRIGRRRVREEGSDGGDGEDDADGRDGGADNGDGQPPRPSGPPGPKGPTAAQPPPRPDETLKPPRPSSGQTASRTSTRSVPRRTPPRGPAPPADPPARDPRPPPPASPPGPKFRE